MEKNKHRINMSIVDDGPKDGHAWAESADAHRVDGEFANAGDHYVTAAYAHLAEGPPQRYCKHISWALYRFLIAGVCYRMAEQPKRCRNRCREGILIAEDTVERVQELPKPGNAYDHARRGAWYEYVGDLRMIADISGAEDAYARAKAIYDDAGDPSCGYSEQEHMRLHDFFRNIAFPRNHDAEDWYRIEAEASLTAWVEYKSTYLPGYLKELYQQTEWKYQADEFQ